MSNLQVAFIGLTFLAFVVVTAFLFSRIYAEGQLRPFFWPALNHGYQVGLVIRLAVVPWLIVLFASGGNGLSILLFHTDVVGTPAANYVPWLAVAALSMLLMHLIDYRRSVIAAFLGFVIFAAMAGLLLAGLLELAERHLVWLAAAALALPLLWALNGVRATYAERIMG